MKRAKDHDPLDPLGFEDSEDSEDMVKPAERTGRDPFDDPPDERAGGLPELLRRIMTVGFSGLFTTEAAIRGALGETVPREWVDFIAEQSERTRNEFITRLAHEFAHVLKSVDIVELAEQLLEGRTVEVNAEIRLRPREPGPKRRSRRSGPPSRAADGEPSSPGEPGSDDADAAAQPAGGGGSNGRP